LEVRLNRKTLFIGVAILAVLIAVTAFMYFGQRPSLTGSVIDPPWSAPEISLVDHNGDLFTLSQQRGKVVLLYFGYVNCPDECPLTMAHLKVALDSLGDASKDAQVIMVSTDPTRDTAAALRDFMGRFDPSFLGLTGTPQELGEVWEAYGVHVEHEGETHSTYLYVIDTAGVVRETLYPDTEPADIARDVGLLLKGN
jgi:protein SCO1/2